MERKPKPVDRDEFERAHKAIKSSRYSEIKEGGKVSHVTFVCRYFKFAIPRHCVCSVPRWVYGHGSREAVAAWKHGARGV